MPFTSSPLRYPGGKSKLYNTIRPVIERTLIGKIRTYVEPFAGGGGLALELLFRGDVDRIVLNDIDYGVYCFWWACVNDNDTLIRMIQSCDVSIDMWKAQKTVYDSPISHSSTDVGFATFFLNRCNVSGVIRGGPIGGKNQSGTYRLDARFNKESLVDKVSHIGKCRECIDVYNMDASAFMCEILPKYDVDSTILNIDPPYVNKGSLLYVNYFQEADHVSLSNVIKMLNNNWIVTYDECALINALYDEYRRASLNLYYSTGRTKSGRELIIFSDGIKLPISYAPTYEGALTLS